MTIRVQNPDKSFQHCTLEAVSAVPGQILFTGCGIENREFKGQDLFDAFTNLRLELEKSGYRLLLAGARPDVFPSGMSRSMGGGRKAYILRMGSPARLSDLVDIFEDADPEQVGSVEQQRTHHKAWVAAFVDPELARPFEGEIAEAKNHPNGWVYRVAGTFDPKEKVPPEAIVGAWKVDADGRIIGRFEQNKKYDPARWPKRTV